MDGIINTAFYSFSEIRVFFDTYISPSGYNAWLFGHLILLILLIACLVINGTFPLDAYFKFTDTTKRIAIVFLAITTFTGSFNLTFRQVEEIPIPSDFLETENVNLKLAFQEQGLRFLTNTFKVQESARERLEFISISVYYTQALDKLATPVGKYEIKDPIIQEMFFNHWGPNDKITYDHQQIKPSIQTRVDNLIQQEVHEIKEGQRAAFKESITELIKVISLGALGLEYLGELKFFIEDITKRFASLVYEKKIRPLVHDLAIGLSSQQIGERLDNAKLLIKKYINTTYQIETTEDERLKESIVNSYIKKRNGDETTTPISTSKTESKLKGIIGLKDISETKIDMLKIIRHSQLVDRYKQRIIKRKFTQREQERILRARITSVVKGR